LTEKEEEEERQALLTALQNKNVKQRKAASKPKGSSHGKGMFICVNCLYVDLLEDLKYVIKHDLL